MLVGWQSSYVEASIINTLSNSTYFGVESTHDIILNILAIGNHEFLKENDIFSESK